MKILQSIKSMNSQLMVDNHNQMQEDLKNGSVLFDMTHQEAANKINNLMSSYVIKCKSESSDQLRALLLTHGNLVNKEIGYKAGDILVISAANFHRSSIVSQPHSMIIRILSTEPFNCEILELRNWKRNNTSVQIGSSLQSVNENSNLYFFMSTNVTCDIVQRYVNRMMCSNCLYKVYFDFGEICRSFITTVDKLETQRNKLSKQSNKQYGAFYGIYRCNNFVYDVIKLASEMKINEA